MKKFLSLVFFSFLAFFAMSALAATSSGVHSKAHQEKAAPGTVHLYFFWSNDCPHCVAAHPFINRLKQQYSWLKVHEYEVSDNPKNGQLFEKMARDHGKKTSFVPTFFIGDKMIVGYTSEESTGSEIKEAILANHKK